MIKTIKMGLKSLIFSCWVVFAFVGPTDGCYWICPPTNTCGCTWNCEQHISYPNYVPQRHCYKANITMSLAHFYHVSWPNKRYRLKEFENNVKYFIAHHANYWAAIEENTINIFKNISFIDLSSNRIERLSRPFTGLTFLKHLNLSNNEIEMLSDESLVISDFDNSLEILDLSHNKLTYIQGSVLSNLRNLQKLILANNRIEKLHADCFQNLSQLTYLDIRHNSLTDIKDAIINSSKLEYLDLSYNFIENVSLSGEVVLHSVPLIHLNLSHNNIKIIQFDFFQNFPLIEVIDLSDNKIHSLQDLRFKSNKNLTYLNLFSNNISSIVNVTTGDSLFDSNNFQYFNIEHNNVTGNITKNAFKGCRFVTLLSVTHQFIQGLGEFAFSNLSNVQTLNFSHNIISTIENSSFFNANSLTVLDVSHNQISNLCFIKMISINLTELYINNNQIKNVPSNTFLNHNSIKTLVMHENHIIILEQNWLCTNNLEYIDVKYNNISGSISNNMFSPSKLRSLDLSNMNYYSIDESSFESLPQLKSLNISHNNLNYIHPHNFKDVNELEVLSLSFNNLTDLDLDYYLNVIYIYLDHNSFTNVPNTFQKEARLVAMNISSNEISSISVETFRNLTNLQVLDVSYNKVTELAPGIFQNLQRLLVLNVSFNLIEKLGFGCFWGLTHVVRLDLSYNKISYLEEYLFHDCPSLKELIVDNNNIAFINIATLKEVSGLNTLSLGGNSITCKDVMRLRLEYTAVKITSLSKVHHDNNVRGITCVHSHNTTAGKGGSRNVSIDREHSTLATNGLLEDGSKLLNSEVTTVRLPKFNGNSTVLNVVGEQNKNDSHKQGEGLTTTLLFAWCGVLNFIILASILFYVGRRRKRRLEIQHLSGSQIQFKNSYEVESSSVTLS